MQNGRLGVVEPTPLGRFDRRRQDMHPSGITLCLQQTELLLIGGGGRREWHDRRCALRRGGCWRRGCSLLSLDLCACERNNRADHYDKKIAKMRNSPYLQHL